MSALADEKDDGSGDGPIPLRRALGRNKKRTAPKNRPPSKLRVGQGTFTLQAQQFPVNK
jgi:hypothetical protein